MNLKISRRIILASFMAFTVAPKGFAQSEDVAAVRLFFSSLIGAPVETRKAEALRVIKEVEPKISADPFNGELLMLHLAALGTLARASGFKDSVKNKYGSRSRDALTSLENILPAHPWTLTLSGLWHLEVVRRGGLVGSSLLGASQSQGLKDLNEANQKLGNQDAGIPFAFGVAILSFEPENYSAQAKELLERSVSIASQSPSDPISAKVSQFGGSLIEKIDAGDLKGAATIAQNLL